MLEQLLDEATAANSRKGGRQEASRIMQQIINTPDEAIAAMITALGVPDKLRQATAIEVIRLIGYPKNEPTIPLLITYLADINHPGWPDVVDTLVDMGPDVIVPHLIRRMIGPGFPYSLREGNLQEQQARIWYWDVYGICSMLSWQEIDQEYVLRCCPVVNFLLTQIGVQPLSPEGSQTQLHVPLYGLLDVIQRAGDQVSYVLPTLIQLTKRYQGNEIGKRTRALIASYKPEELAPYQLLLSQLPAME